MLQAKLRVRRQEWRQGKQPGDWSRHPGKRPGTETIGEAEAMERSELIPNILWRKFWLDLQDWLLGRRRGRTQGHT